MPYFNSLYEFPFITYRKNIFKGYAEIQIFNQKLHELKRELERYENIRVYISDSAWLPSNVLLHQLVKQPKVTTIYRITGGEISRVGTKKSALRTRFARIYRALIPAFPIEALVLQNGQFADFIYQKPAMIPGKRIRFVPVQEASDITQEIDEEIQTIPYPVLSRPYEDHAHEPDTVIVFGDAGVLDFPEYIDNQSEAVKKLHAFFNQLENTYHHSLLYYKPHPADSKKTMPGVVTKQYRFFADNTNTQEILEEYYHRIKAVYTCSSSSAELCASWGIPSYTFYRYIYNTQGALRYDAIFNSKNLQSPCLHHVSSLQEIGAYDAHRFFIKTIDLHEIPAIYHKLFEL